MKFKSFILSIMMLLPLQGQAETDKLTFTNSNNFTNEYLQNNFWRLNYNSAGEDLKYSVIVPKDVRPTSIEPKLDKAMNLNNIGVYTRVESKAPYLEVWVYTEHLDGLVQPENWVKSKLALTGHEVVAQHELTSSAGNKYVDILSRSKDGQFIARTTEYVNGKGDYVMLTVFCDSKDYEALADTIQHITSSWKLG